MRWVCTKDENPDKAGQYWCWHHRYGKCVMGYQGGWGPQRADGSYDAPTYFLKDDQCPHQQLDGSFNRGGER